MQISLYFTGYSIVCNTRKCQQRAYTAREQPKTLREAALHNKSCSRAEHQLKLSASLFTFTGGLIVP